MFSNLSDETEDFFCDEPIEKFKASKTKSKSFPKDISGKMFEVTMQIDKNKRISLRQSYQVLDLIANIGGFIIGMSLMFFYIGHFMSAKFYIQDIAESMFFIKQEDLLLI
jgi:hypothetical protein